MPAIRLPQILVQKLRTLVWGQFGRRSPAENAFLVLLPIVGALVGLTSVGIAHLIAFLQTRFWGGGENLLDAAQANPWPLRIIIPVIGGLIVGVIGWVYRVETRGGGTSGMIQALEIKGGYISLKQTVP